MTPTDKEIGRCRQLLRLAKQSPYPAEAENARLKAREMIKKYSITNEMLASHRDRHDSPRRRRPAPPPPPQPPQNVMDELIRKMTEEYRRMADYSGYQGTLRYACRKKQGDFVLATLEALAKQQDVLVRVATSQVKRRLFADDSLGVKVFLIGTRANVVKTMEAFADYIARHEMNVPTVY